MMYTLCYASTGTTRSRVSTRYRYRGVRDRYSTGYRVEYYSGIVGIVVTSVH